MGRAQQPWRRPQISWRKEGHFDTSYICSIIKWRPGKVLPKCSTLSKLFMIKASLWLDCYHVGPDDGMMMRLICLIFKICYGLLYHDHQYYCYWGKFKAYNGREFCVFGCCCRCTLSSDSGWMMEAQHHHRPGSPPSESGGGSRRGTYGPSAPTTGFFHLSQSGEEWERLLWG